MTRIWKPIDIAPGGRLYEVRLHWCMKQEHGGKQGTERYIVAASAPMHAAEIIEKIYKETYDSNPHMSYWGVSGHALNVLQPKEWWESDVPETAPATIKRLQSLLDAYRAKRAVDGGGNLERSDGSSTPPRKWDAVVHYDEDLRITDLEAELIREVEQDVHQQ